MAWQNYSNKHYKEVFKELDSNSVSGLSKEELDKRLLSEGVNTINKKNVDIFHILWRQFKSPFIYLLFAAAVLSFFFSGWIEAIMILAFILINTVLGFFQEFRSEKTVKLLAEYINWQSRVIRGGQELLVDTESLVPGDIILLETGDRIGADARIFWSQNFGVDEAAFTGESAIVFKSEEELSYTGSGLEDANNMLFAGSSVVSGKAKAIVTATGNKTEFGKIASLTAETKSLSNFEKNITKFSSFILKLTILTLAFVILLNFILKGRSLNWSELFIFAIALAIGVIPEALPLVMTFSFSKGAAQLAKQKVVVKRLSAVEDLGNINVLCSDKTGTLTENSLKICDRFTSKEGAQEELLHYALLASANVSDNLDPFDLAIKEEVGSDSERIITEYEQIFDSPFDPRFMRNNVLIKRDNKFYFIVRGALEIIAPMCKDGDLEGAVKWSKEQGEKGNRVLALALKELDEIDFSNFEASFREEEKDLNLLGLLAFSDPIKPSTLEAVAKANELGVDIKIITGDSLEVALTVAKEIGISHSNLEGIDAKDFFNLDEEKRKELLKNIHVFSRVSPEEKHRIIKILQEDFSVGYLGDGINDAPALKAAGVSLAVHNASDIAREAADIILLENDLNTIIEGIKEGRLIFANSFKYIKATLASNFGNFYAVAIASLLIDFLPMLPLQILLLNLLSDFPMIAIAGDNVDKEELRSPKSYEIKDVIIVTLILGIISTVFDFVFFALFWDKGESVLQTNWFIASVITELVFIFSIRSFKPFYKAKRPGKALLLLTIPAFILAIGFPYLSLGKTLFSFQAPSLIHISWILGISLIYFISTEIFKIMYYRKKRDADLNDDLLSVETN